MKNIIDHQRVALNLKQCLGKVHDYLDKNPVQQDMKQSELTRKSITERLTMRSLPKFADPGL